MKKFQILGTVLLLSVVTILLVACQKEQDGVTNEVNNRNSSETVTAIEVNASDIPGIIDRNEAANMAARYEKSNMNKTLAVSFDIKDIQNYLNVLKRERSSKIFVNFGMYENGRLTVFFSGDKKSSNGSVRGNFDDSSERFLNHGGLVP
ncbi:MAG: hypothetical protein IBJ16_09900 [Chitinophagaceae bacterium]|nr:hypothetical protein [Chitinophagaceae bacterium]